MHFRALGDRWNQLGETDPFWAVLTEADKRHGRWNPEEFFASGQREISGALRYIASHGVNLERHRALDFGCGAGRLTQALNAAFSEVVGVDIAPSMVRPAEKWNRHGPRCTDEVNSRPDLSIFPSGEFDLVYGSLVLQHMAPRHSLGYIREFVRLLKPGGCTLFQIPSRPAWNAVGCLLRILPQAAVRPVRKIEMHGIAPESVRACLGDAGAVLVDQAPDAGAGPNWIGFRYLARKASPPVGDAVPGGAAAAPNGANR